MLVGMSPNQPTNAKPAAALKPRHQHRWSKAYKLLDVAMILLGVLDAYMALHRFIVPMSAIASLGRWVGWPTGISGILVVAIIPWGLYRLRNPGGLKVKCPDTWAVLVVAIVLLSDVLTFTGIYYRSAGFPKPDWWQSFAYSIGIASTAGSALSSPIPSAELYTVTYTVTEQEVLTWMIGLVILSRWWVFSDRFEAADRSNSTTPD